MGGDVLGLQWINEYEDLSGYIDRMADGESDVLFHGHTDYFISTSGTTGKAKLIPEGDVSRDAKNAVNKIRNAYMTRDLVRSMMSSESVIGMIRSKGLDPRTTTPQQFADNFHYYSVTSAIPDRKTSGGIDVGFASGKTFESSSFSKGLAYPSEFMGLADGEATMYLTMLFALMHDDVMIVTSNNAARLYARICYAMEHAEEIIRDMRDGTIKEDLALSESERRTAEGHMSPHPERAAELQAILDSGRENFIPRSYWPNLVSARFWLSGSVGVNVAKVRPLLPENTVYYDIGYGASEAKISIPHGPECGYGTLATMSVFYEFVPVEGGEPLTADQLEEGREYELLLTNYGGLYRYMIHDIVKVRHRVRDQIQGDPEHRPGEAARAEGAGRRGVHRVLRRPDGEAGADLRERPRTALRRVRGAGARTRPRGQGRLVRVAGFRYEGDVRALRQEPQARFTQPS